MIPVSISAAFLVPFLITILFLMIIWLYYALRDAQRMDLQPKERIYRCNVCQHVYVDGRDLPLVRCPRCGCLNDQF